MEVQLKPTAIPQTISVEVIDTADFDSTILQASNLISTIDKDDEEPRFGTFWSSGSPPLEWLVESQNYIANLPKISQLILIAYTFGGNKLLAWQLDDAIEEITSDVEIMPENFCSIAPVVWSAAKSGKLKMNIVLPDDFDGNTYEVVKGLIGNRALRTEDWRTVKAWFLDELQKIIFAAPRPSQPVTVYRGEPQMMLGNPNGDLVTTGITSTSLSFPAALDFASMECCVKEITIERGSPALFVGFASVYTEEFEVLIPAESKMKLTALPATYRVSWDGDCVKTVDMIMTKFLLRKP